MRMKDKKILIIEDDTFLSNIYKTKLTKEGFSILMADNGEDGLALMKSEKPVLVLLDIMLPKMDGFEVLERVQKDAKLKKIPIVIMSNLGQDSDVEKGKTLGAVDYIVKSDTTLENVITTINKYL
jgi:DNA-binding response OmpR family regulator